MTRCIPQWLSPVVEAPSSPGSAPRNRPGTAGVRPVEPPTIGIRKDPKTLGVCGDHPYTVFVIACNCRIHKSPKQNIIQFWGIHITYVVEEDTCEAY